MAEPTARTTPRSVPRELRHRIGMAAREALRSGGCWPSTRLRWRIAVEVGPDALASIELDQVLAADPLLWRLPDGSWLHVGAATWDRLFTVRVPPTGPPAGVVHGGPDLAAALLSFGGWSRIPVRARRARGFAEALPGRWSDRRLVLAAGLAPLGMPLLGVSPGPEGIRVIGVDVDEIASSRLGQRLEADAARHAARGSTPLAWSPDHVPDPAVTRAWTVLDVELAAMARDPSLRRSATRPLRDLLSVDSPPLADSA